MINFLDTLKTKYFVVVGLLLSFSVANGQRYKRYIYQPVIDGEWRSVNHNPYLGKYTSDRQQPVDFCVWQAADGTWQLLSCVRGTKADGRTRVLYRWETDNLLDSNWTPKGIAMEADTVVGEEKSGLQAPNVLKVDQVYYLFYGDWNHICLAKSTNGKRFERVINKQNTTALFGGPFYNTRDPMVLKIGSEFYCYYCGHLEKDIPSAKLKSAVFCRTSKDLRLWSNPVIVSGGGKAATQSNWYGGDSECPFVVRIKDRYILFRNQVYGAHSLNTQYCSADPLDFGVNNDKYLMSQLPVAAPEIIKAGDQYYIISLKPGLDGMRIAKLKFVKKYL